MRDVSVGLGGVDFEGELGYAGAGAGTLSPPRAPQLAPVRSPSSEQISPSAGMSSPGGGGGGATLLNEDIRRISEKIHDMHMSSRPRGHSPRGHSPYGQSPQGRSPQTMSPQALSPHSPHSPHTGILPPNRLYERRIENEKLKREDLGRMDDSFRLTQSDYVFQRGIGLDRGYELDRGHGVGGNGMGNGNGGVAPVLPLRSPHRRPSAASGGNGSPGTGYGGNGNGNGGGYMQAQGNGSGNGNGHGGQQGVRGWNEEAAGWV